MSEKLPMDIERKTFEAGKSEWQVSHLGKFVLIKGTKVLGFFESLEAATKKGFELFGLEDFFVKQVHPKDTVNVSLVGRFLRTA